MSWKPLHTTTPSLDNCKRQHQYHTNKTLRDASMFTLHGPCCHDRQVLLQHWWCETCARRHKQLSKEVSVKGYALTAPCTVKLHTHMKYMQCVLDATKMKGLLAAVAAKQRPHPGLGGADVHYQPTMEFGLAVLELFSTQHPRRIAADAGPHQSAR
jgi:hypothetical protein